MGPRPRKYVINDSGYPDLNKTLEKTPPANDPSRQHNGAASMRHGFCAPGRVFFFEIKGSRPEFPFHFQHKRGRIVPVSQ